MVVLDGQVVGDARRGRHPAHVVGVVAQRGGAAAELSVVAAVAAPVAAAVSWTWEMLQFWGLFWLRIVVSEGILPSFYRCPCFQKGLLI